MLRRGNLHGHDGLAAAEMVDQQESCECEENQKDCHKSPRRRAV
jgi:hypothetical protein